MRPPSTVGRNELQSFQTLLQPGDQVSVCGRRVEGEWGGAGVGKRGRGLEPWRIYNKFTGEKKKKQKREKQWKQRQQTVLSSWFCRLSWTVSFSHQAINCSHLVASKKITHEYAQRQVYPKLRLWLSLRTNKCVTDFVLLDNIHVTLHWTFIHPETFLPCMLHFAVSLILFSFFETEPHAATMQHLILPSGDTIHSISTFLHLSTQSQLEMSGYCKDRNMQLIMANESLFEQGRRGVH